MAMTKKEQEEMAALKRALLVAQAFRMTDKVKPDVAPPNSAAGLSVSIGWLLRGSEVEQGWSRASAHGTGAPEKSKYSGSQGARWLFSTEVLALRALRNAIESDTANRLADIDARIQKAMGSTNE